MEDLGGGLWGVDFGGGDVTWQWGLGIGDWGVRAGTREAGALSIAGVTLTLFAVRGSLANLSGEFTMTDLPGSSALPAPSPAGQSFARA